MPNITPRSQESFNSASSRFNTQRSEDAKSIKGAIREKARVVQIRAGEHYQKHRPKWIEREQAMLERTKGNAPELKPPGAPPRDFRSEASRNVHNRHAHRMARISLSERRMLIAVDRSNDLSRGG